MTSASVGIDDASKVSSKTTTTVAMDFGRITIDEALVLYVFGTPGQDRFGFMWDDLVQGALGALVLVDTRRLDDCYPAVDYFEARRIPFVVGINRFDGTDPVPVGDIREALSVADGVPVVFCDARSRESAKDAILCLLELLLHRVRQQQRHSKRVTMNAARALP